MQQQEASPRSTEQGDGHHTGLCRGWILYPDQWERICEEANLVTRELEHDLNRPEWAEDMTRPFADVETELHGVMCSVLRWFADDTGLLPWPLTFRELLPELCASFRNGVGHSLGCLMAAYRWDCSCSQDHVRLDLEQVLCSVETCIFPGRMPEETALGRCCSRPDRVSRLRLRGVHMNQAQGLLCIYTYITAMSLLVVLDSRRVLNELRPRFDPLWRSVSHLLETGVDNPGLAK